MLSEMPSCCVFGCRLVLLTLQEEGKTRCYVLTLTNTVTQERNAQNI